MSDDTGQQTSLDEVLDKHMSKHKEQDRNTKDGEELFGIGKIPSDWKVVEMDDCVEIIPGNSPPSSTYNDSGDGLPFFQGNAEFGHLYPDADTWCSDPRKVAEEMDILMSIRAPVGDLNIADKKCCIGRGLAGLRPTRINGLYLFYFLAKRNAWLSRLATGSTFKSVTKSDLQRLDIASPPLSEQHKIASVLYNLDKSIQKTEEIIQQTNRLHTGLRRDLVISGIDHDEFQEMRVGPFTFEIPADWEIVSVEGACENLDKDRIPVKQSKREEMQGDIPYYGASGIIDYVDDYLFEDDLILLAEDGENLLSRNLPISFKISGKAWVNNHAHVLKPREEFDIDYLVEYFERLNYEPFVTGSAQPKLTQTNMDMLSVPKPPEEEQAEISSILTSISDQKNRSEHYKEQLQRLKQGLMQDLLSGEVRTHNKDIEVLPEVEKHG